jgi:hypothetical protein
MHCGGDVVCVCTAQVNDGGIGYTNGFYIGSPRLLAPILRRLDNLSTLDASKSYRLDLA